MTQHLYVDGGCVGRNPSKIGGTWAWCHVIDDEMVRWDFGVVRPMDACLDAITNNFTELLAAVYGLEAMEEESLAKLNRKWKGIVHTDSKVTLRRLTDGKRFNGIPQWLRLLALDLRRDRKWTPVLIGGHPTKAELRTGYRKGTKLPVSEWNAWCDEACREEAKRFLDSKGGKG